MTDTESDPGTGSWLDQLKWDEKGLIPAIAQDDQSGAVLMMAWMNREALSQTAETGQAVYWSRSRGKLWRKGESSGHTQQVSGICTDCDADVVLLKVHQQGGIACHTGRYSCFYRQLDEPVHSSENGQENKRAWLENAPILKDPGEIYSSDK